MCYFIDCLHVLRRMYLCSHQSAVVILWVTLCLRVCCADVSAVSIESLDSSSTAIENPGLVRDETCQDMSLTGGMESCAQNSADEYSSEDSSHGGAALVDVDGLPNKTCVASDYTVSWLREFQTFRVIPGILSEVW